VFIVDVLVLMGTREDFHPCQINILLKFGQRVFNKIENMGKLMNHLTRQLKDPEHQQDAEECIEIYNWIKDTDKDGCVWSSRWTPLVDITFKGYPSDIRRYKLNITGATLLKGIKNNG